MQGACIERTRPSHNINMINILYKQKVKTKWIIKRFSKGTGNSKLICREFLVHVIVLGYLLVKKNSGQSRPLVRFIATMALFKRADICTINVESDIQVLA